MMVCAGNDNLAGFKQLPQRVDTGLANSASSSRNSTPQWASEISPAAPSPRHHQCRHGRRMVRVAERTRLDQPAGGKLAGNRMQHRDVQCLARGQGGRSPGSRAASIDLPAPGGPTISRL